MQMSEMLGAVSGYHESPTIGQAEQRSVDNILSWLAESSGKNTRTIRVEWSNGNECQL
jgi:hypothetical protein